MIRLNPNKIYGDITCPHCGMKYEPEWDTEYGDAMNGDFKVECHCGCQKSFTVSVTIEVKYSSLKTS